MDLWLFSGMKLRTKFDTILPTLTTIMFAMKIHKRYVLFSIFLTKKTKWQL